MLAIVSPTAHRTLVQWLPHLPLTRRHYYPFGIVECQAGGIPIQAKERDEPTATGLQILHEILISHFQHRKRQRSLPVGHQSLERAGPCSKVGKVSGPRQILSKRLRITRKTHVPE